MIAVCAQQNIKKMTTSAVAVLFVFVMSLATSILARPPLVPYSFDEYTDNNILGSIPDDVHDETMFAKPEREEILEM